MKISVVVPVYNVERYLEECLNSILQQNFSGYEIICVEDCSTDRSGNILKKYEGLSSNIKIIWNAYNKGLSSARNIGLENAEGEYVLFVDSDDYLMQGALKRLYMTASQHKCDVVYFNKKVLYESDWKGTEPGEKKYCCAKDVVMTGREAFVKFMNQDCMKSLNAYTQFFSREFLNENQLRFCDRLIHEDYLFFFQSAMSAKRVLDLNEALYVYRKRRNSLTTYVSEGHKQSIFYTFLQIFYYWKRNATTTEEDGAIRVFLGKVYMKCIQYKEAVRYRGGLKFGDVADNFLYERIMNTENVEFSAEEWQKIHAGDRVWIYGAGRVARETALLFEQEKVEAYGVVVSQKTQTHFMGWGVLQMDEVRFDTNDVVVIAIANKIVVREIAEKLANAGVKGIIQARKFNE